MPAVNRIANTTAKGYGFLLSASLGGYDALRLTSESGGTFLNNIKLGSSVSTYLWSVNPNYRIYGLTFSPDGLRCFFGYNLSAPTSSSNLGAFTIKTLDLVTPYNFSGATLPYSDQTTFNIDGGIRDFKFNGDGTEFIVSNWRAPSGVNTYEFITFPLGTPYDLSTAGAGTTTAGVARGGFCFNSNGTKLYIANFGLDQLYEYTLSTPYDVTSRTLSYTADDLYLGAGEINYVEFNSDGTQLYFLDDDNNIRTITLTTGFDLSTITDLARCQISVEFLGSLAGGFVITPTDDRVVYLQGYPNGSSGNRAIQSISINTSVCELPGWIWPSGFGGSAATNYSYQNQWMESLRLRMGTFKSDGTKAYFLGYYNTPSPAETAIWEVDLPTPYDLRSITVAQIPTTYTIISALGPAWSPTSTSGVSFNFSPDGTKLFVWDASFSLHSYSLSTAWDLTSISHVADINAGISHFYFRFKPDGTQIFGSFSNALYTYDLGTPWDITTLNTTPVRTITVSNPSITFPRAFTFSPTGRQLTVYLSNTAITDSINQYFLSIPYDTDTATLQGTVSLDSIGTLAPTNINMIQEVSLRFLEWNSNGTNLNIVASIANVNYGSYATARVFSV